MLYAWGFERIGVVLSDAYFVDPVPPPDQGGAEHGVRLEVRLLDRQPLHGSVYSAQPILINDALWRADLFETVDGQPGSHDRTHHHPNFRDWEPRGRTFDPAMLADPPAWVGDQLCDLDTILEGAGVPASEVGPDDARQLREAVPEIVDTLRRVLARVRAGELAHAVPADPVQGARGGWL